jgi:hypothetical protein
VTFLTLLFRKGSLVKVFEPATVKLERSVSGRSHVKKEKYTVASLPFPRGSASNTYTQRWRRIFKPSLIEWAATFEDPFGTNAEMDAVVEALWSRLYPTLTMAVSEGEGRAAITQIVRIYSSWCR